MDKIAQSANQSRSVRGGDFESRVEGILSDLRERGKSREFFKKTKDFWRRI